MVSANNFSHVISLVLYGKNMGKVDELYRKEIDEKGGYSKYIGNSLNFVHRKKAKLGSLCPLHLRT